MPNVLILGGRSPAALDLARRFRRQCWTVRVADSIPCRLSGWSRAVTATLPLAPPRQAPSAFVADVAKAIRAHAIDLVVPTCEEVFYLSRYRAALPGQVRVLADDFDQLRLLHSKWHFLQLARDCGAGVPASCRVATIAEAGDWAAGAPLALKPEFSRFGTHVRLYPDGLPAQAPELAHAGTWVAQRYTPGNELCSYSIADRGRLVAHALYRPTYRLRRSSSYYFEPSQSEVIRDFAAAFVRKIDFTGQIAFDWIEGADGTMTVLECNPRAISGLHLFAAEDDVPSALVGDRAACLVPSRARPAMIAPIMLSAGLGAAVASSTLRTWWRDYRRADDVITAPGDRRPAVGAVLDLCSFARLARTQGCNLREAATRDIEWDGEALGPL